MHTLLPLRFSYVVGQLDQTPPSRTLQSGITQLCSGPVTRGSVNSRRPEPSNPGIWEPDDPLQCVAGNICISICLWVFLSILISWYVDFLSGVVPMPRK
jgi:hypothetical protein